MPWAIEPDRAIGVPMSWSISPRPYPGVPPLRVLALVPDPAGLDEGVQAPANGQHAALALADPPAQLGVAEERLVAAVAAVVVAADVVDLSRDLGRLEPRVLAPHRAPADARGERQPLVAEVSREAALDAAEALGPRPSPSGRRSRRPGPSRPSPEGPGRRRWRRAPPSRAAPSCPRRGRASRTRARRARPPRRTCPRRRPAAARRGCPRPSSGRPSPRRRRRARRRGSPPSAGPGRPSTRWSRSCAAPSPARRCVSFPKP